MNIFEIVYLIIGCVGGLFAIAYEPEHWYENVFKPFIFAFVLFFWLPMLIIEGIGQYFEANS